MRRTIGVLLVLLSFGLVAPLSAQDRGAGSAGQQESGFQLEQNYPNPFNPETRIPFLLNEEIFADGRPVVVSMRIYNLLQQEVDAPAALRHPSGDGVPLVQLEYTSPGRYEAYWDGKDRNGREVASGIYFVQLTVKGQSKTMKMFVTK